MKLGDNMDYKVIQLPRWLSKIILFFKNLFKRNKTKKGQ